MNVDPMNNGTTLADHTSSEQHPTVDNQADENSTQNDTKSKEVVNVINKMKKTLMTPTPLYVSFFSSQSS
jgi:hypothetical protein